LGSLAALRSGPADPVGEFMVDRGERPAWSPRYLIVSIRAMPMRMITSAAI